MQRLLVVICVTLERSDHNILSSNLTEVHKFIEEDDGEEEMCKAQRAMC